MCRAVQAVRELFSALQMARDLAGIRAHLRANTTTK